MGNGYGPGVFLRRPMPVQAVLLPVSHVLSFHEGPGSHSVIKVEDQTVDQDAEDGQEVKIGHPAAVKSGYMCIMDDVPEKGEHGISGAGKHDHAQEKGLDF